MNKLMKTTIAAAVTGMLVSPLAMANPANLNLNASILDGTLTAAEAAPLNFGGFYVTAAGTVVVAPDGAVTPSAEAVAHDGGHQAGTIDVAGTPNQTVTIDPIALVTLTDPVSSDTMTADTFVVWDAADAVVATDSTTTFTLDGTGAHQLRVGATLNFAGTETAGDYAGVATVTVNY